jgi:muramoyltetrapeptide carboxypeptidase
MKRRKFIKNTSLLTVGGIALSSFTNSKSEQLKKISPTRLKRGDTIALTAPAGAIFNKTHIEKIEKRLTTLGFKTKRGKTLFMQEGYLAGDDTLRAKEINDFFKDPAIKAILAMRGGWGCARILDLIDYELIKNNPKIIMGYSDITSLLIAITKKTGLITFHGPMGYSSWKQFSTQQVMNVLVEGKTYKMYNPKDYLEGLETLSPGKSSGEIIGGNLTVVTSLIGTKYEPDWNNKILFLEETSEEPYRIDRMLWQLKLAGVYNKINGCVLGAFNKCVPEEPQKSFSLNEVLNQHFKHQHFPVYKGAAFGHIVPKFTLPIGIKVKINATDFYIELLEESVK